MNKQLQKQSPRLARLMSAGIGALAALALTACNPGALGNTTSNNVSLIVSPTTNELYVFNLLTHRVIDRMQTGARPDDIAVSNDSRRVLVTNANDGSLSVIERLTGTDFIGRGRVNVQGTTPQGAVFNSSGDRAYVTVGDTSSIAILDTRRPGELPSLIRSVRIPFNEQSGSRPNPTRIAISPDNGRLFVIDRANSALLAFNQTQADNFALAEFFRPNTASPVEFRDVVVDRNGRVYVLDSANDQLVVFNGANIQAPVGQVSLRDGQFPVISPENIALGKQLNRLFITGSAANIVSVINNPAQIQGNVSIQQVGQNVPINGDPRRPATSPTGIDVTSNDQQIYVSNGGGGFNISLLEVAGNQVIPLRNFGTAVSAANAPPLGRMKIVFFSTQAGLIPGVRSENSEAADVSDLDAPTPPIDSPEQALRSLRFF
ncbi:MAG: YncE family protein [Candidatus Sericytochromatia bacterium]|nr:YncE family protein [Candidatus Sericytochromatia bacterium]